MIRNYKVNIIIFIVAGCLNCAYTQQVSRGTAVEVAEKFISSKAVQLNLSPGNLQIRDLQTSRAGSHILYYIINYNNGGYILISADKRFYPVLAYSFEGDFNPGKVPENCRSWIQVYESQMKHVLENGGDFFQEMPALWDKFEDTATIETKSRGIIPLTSCTWAQDGYYNQMCPADPDAYNGHTPVGCVALAMAELMYYYRFPASGNGSVEYTPPYQGGEYGPQYVNFDASTYEWGDMTDICRDPNDEISQICYHAGVAIQTAYGPQTSGANIVNVPAALTGHFFYLADDYLPRSEVPEVTVWATMLMQNLDERQPVLYRSSLGWGGHVYICDGYQDSSHFHFNWGWGGAYNGYFYIDDLAPGGININADQGAVFNIYPDTSLFQYPVTGPDSSVLTTNAGSFEDGSGPFNYSPDLERSWLIKPVDNEITNIFLEFSRIETESGVDIIRVYDGDSEGAPLIATLSGIDFPASFNSSGPSFFITFESDGQTGGNGFQASYYGYHLPFCSGTGILTEPAGILDDGSRYLNYLNDTDCEWIISPYLSAVDSVARVRFYFNRFNLAQGDTVFIYDGADNLSPLLYSFHQNNAPQGFMASGGYTIFINFKTNPDDTGQGWELGWDYILPEYCADTIKFNLQEAVVSDGSGANNYIENMDCFYNIDVPNGERITVSFSEFDLEVAYDYLKFIDPDHPYLTLAMLSGHDIPDAFTFSVSELLVHFHTDDRDNFSGWTFTYTTSFAGIDEIDQGFSCSPNPVRDMLFIKINGPLSRDAVYKVYRIDGAMVLSGRLSAANQAIGLDRLTSGLYLIIIENGDEKILNKIVKF